VVRVSHVVVVAKRGDYGPSLCVVTVALRTIAITIAITTLTDGARRSSSTKSVDNCVGKRRADGASSHGGSLGNTLHKHVA
jgi:hypothetical protein